MSRQVDVIANIGGIDYKINDLKITYSICKNRAQANFIIDPYLHRDIVPFSEVIITVWGERIFTGVVDLITSANFPLQTEVECRSRLLQSERNFIAKEYVANWESAEHWLRTFLSQAKIDTYSISNNDTAIYRGHSWSYTNSIDAMRNIIQISNTRLYPTRDGTVTIKSLNSGDNPKTFNLYSHVVVAHHDSYIRNKAIVFGNDVSASVERSNSYLVPGETRTAAISTSLIETSGKCSEVANTILDETNAPLSIITMTVEGYPTIDLNDYIITPFGEGPLTSLIHEINDDGYTTTLIIGEKCPSFFGIDLLEEVQEIYLSAIGNGVWKTQNRGSSWIDISGEELDGVSVYAIHNDETLLWAITKNNIWKSFNKIGDWDLCTVLGNYYATDESGTVHIKKENMHFYDIVSDLDQDRVFVVGQDEESGKIFVLFSEDKSNFTRIYLP